MTDTLQIQTVLNKVLQRFAALGLPDVMQFTPPLDKPVECKMVLFGMKTDSIRWNTMRNYQHALDVITQNKLSYFFPRKIASRGSGFSITGYLMSHSKMQLWYHLLKIEEIYITRNDIPELAEVSLQLYPFIHSENVLSFFENSE